MSNPQPNGAPLWPGLLWLLWLGTLWAYGQTPPPYFQSIKVKDQAAELSMAGPSSHYSALEASTNLWDWLPLTNWLATSQAAQYRDPSLATLPVRFYRVLEVEHQSAIVRINPSSGPVGTVVEILGRFFDPNLQGNRVRFSGAAAKVLQASETRLVVEVPTNATTGPLLLNTSLGAALGQPLYVVSEERLVKFEPLPGMKASDFELATCHGVATPLGGVQATHRLTVNRDRPALIVASPKDTNQNTLYYAVALSGNQILPINTASTAQALVFQHPLFFTLDPLLAEHLVGLIQIDPQVQQFAAVITSLYGQNGDPLTSALFSSAFGAALESVANRNEAQPLQMERSQMRPMVLAGILTPSIEIYEMEPYVTRFLKVLKNGAKVKMQGAGIWDTSFNPVDWVVVFQEIDVPRAFPNGRQDLDNLYHQFSPPPEPFPLVDGFSESRVVSADLAFSRFDEVSYLLKYAAKYLALKRLRRG